jgi:heavy metal sensor kinase
MKFLKSIKWRLQLWYGLILVVVLAGLGFSAYQLERDKVFRHVDNELQRRMNVLVQTVRRTARQGQPQRPPFRSRVGSLPPGAMREPFPEDGLQLAPENFRLQPRDEFLFDAASTNGFYYVIGGIGDKKLARSSNAPFEELSSYPAPNPDKVNQFAPFPPLPKLGQPAYDGRESKYDDFPKGGVPEGQPHPPYLRGSYREIDTWIPLNGPPLERSHPIRILVGRNMSVELAELHKTGLKLTGVGFVILIFGLGGGWWLVNRSLRPIAEISSAATKIAAGDLSQRISVAEAESELGQLAAVLNSTFARLEAAFAQQKQFASDAAHELRTPVTVMLTQTQTALNRERSAEDYRQTVEACQRAAQRMRRLIESLLELTRFDAGQEVLKRVRFDFSKAVSDSLEMVQTLADEKQVKVFAELEALEIMGDPERLAQVVTNLLTNAIQYNQPGGEVRVRLETDGGLAVLTVADTGPGIAPEDLPRVFERFYRAEQSRTGNGNSGLGLSICKAIVAAHGGTIEVASEAGRGSAFTVRLPA